MGLHRWHRDVRRTASRFVALTRVLFSRTSYPLDSSALPISTEINPNFPLSLSSSSTALTVRYLTRRFIGEYRSNTDLLYKQTVTLDSGVLDVEIVDISAENGDDFPVEQIQWADACLVVYSITDRTSYEYAQRSLAELRQLQNSPSAYLIGNKADLDHLREVSEGYAFYLAACPFGIRCNEINEIRAAITFGKVL